MIRVLFTLAVTLLGVWLVAHVLYIGPVQVAAEVAAVWVLGFTAASLVVAAVVLLAVGLAVGRTRPAWLKFVRSARTMGAVVGCALVVVGLLHYRETQPRGEIYWLVLGVVVLLGAGIVHLWLLHAERRELA